MNKLFTKIVGAALGLTMAIGVGVAVASNREAVPAYASSPAVFTTTSSGGFTNDSKTIDDITVSFNLNNGTWQSDHVRVFKNGSFTVSSSTVHMTEIKITCTANYDSNYGPKKINANVGNYATSAGSPVGTWTGDETQVVFDTNTAQARVSQISVAYYTPSSNPEVRLSKTELTLCTADTNGKSVTATVNNFGDGTKYYSWSTEDSNITLSNASTDTVTIQPNSSVAGTATVSVSVYGGNVAQADAKTADVEVSLETPKTVAQALLLSGESDVYTKGIVSYISEVSTANGNATYFISDDGTRTDELEVYRGKYVGNTSFTSENQIQVGDTVVVYGSITTYKETVEYAQGNYLISLKSEARLSLSPSTIEVTVGTEKTVTASPSNFDSGTIVYAFDEDDCATLSYSENTITIHGDEVGNYEFTVTGKVGGVDQASATLAVSVVAPYPTGISRSGYASFTDTQTFAQGTGSLTITYSDESTATKHLGDAGVKLLISDVEVSASASVSSYIGTNSAKISYTENDYTVTTNAYTLNVNAELEITSFEDVPEYLIIDSNDSAHSADVTVNYKSLNGEPTLTITSSNNTKLPVTFDEAMNEYNSETKTGAAIFTVSAGSTAGQYSVTASLTYGLRTETKSFSVVVRGEAPVSSGTYNLVSSYGSLDNGEYVIAGYAGGSYHAMTTSITSGRASKTDLTISNNVITSTVESSMTFTLTKQSGGGYTIVNGTNYIGLPSSNSASLSLGTTNKTEWTVSQGVNGTFRFTNPGYTSRGLVYRAGTTNAFSGYALSNATSSSTEYFDIELFKYVEQAASSFDLVNDFVGNYMHMNDVSIGNESDTGACKGESGYYLTAKKAWNAMVNDYEGEDNLQTVFQNSFEDAYARYNAWAVACNDAAPFDGNDTVVSPIRSSAIIMSINNDTSSVVTIIIMVSLVSLTAIGGYFFIRKRKEQ